MRTRVRIGLAAVALVAATGGSGLVAGPAGAAVAVTVTPATGLLDHHPVTVTASGLEPGTYVVAECVEDDCQRPPSPPPNVFVAPDVAIATAGPAGTLSARLQLDRTPSYGGDPRDCSVDACTVKVIGPVQGTIAEQGSAALAFEPTGDYRWPQASITLARTTGLIDRQRVEVAGAGFDPWSGGIHYTILGTAVTQVCRAVADPAADDCITPPADVETYRDDSSTGVNGDGTVPGITRIRRHLDLPSGAWDCAVGGCTLALTQGGDPVGNRVPISFAPEWAPFPTVDSFIDRAVTGVLGRKPTTAGRARLRAGLPDRSITGVQALVEAAAGSRLDADVGEVVRLYRAYLGRPVESVGLTYWVGRLRAGLTPLQLARTFAGTPEFKARYGTLSEAAAVSLTYRTVLGREPSPTELQYWRERFAAGLTKADLVYSFARSPENRSRTNRAVWSTIVLWRLTGLAPNAEQLAGGPERAATDALVGSHP